MTTKLEHWIYIGAAIAAIVATWWAYQDHKAACSCSSNAAPKSDLYL